MTLQSSIGMEHKKLISVRKAKGFTQKQMADRIAMEQTTYSKKERGISPIREEEWTRFAKILGVSIEDIKDNLIAGYKKTQSATREDSGASQSVLIPQNVFNIIVKYNEKLEEEISLLKQENLKLKGVKSS